MIYRKYGKTGKQVSIVGFGGMRFKNIDDREECVRMVIEAAEGGINYFDTAPGYFGTKSEEVFGEAFRELQRRKIPFYCATKTSKSDEKSIRQEVEQQLKRLNIDAIDFYHIWCIITLDEWYRRKRNGVIETLIKLKEEGLIRHICVSSHLIGDQVKEVLSEEAIEGILLGYSVFNFSLREPALEEVAKRNLGCVVMNPLGGGIIPQNPELFEFVKTKKDESVVEASLRFLFAHPSITSALVGFGERDEIKQALNAVNGYQGISQAEIERIKANTTEAFNELCTGCRYCDNCPEGIPVPKLMDAYNYKRLYGENKRVLDRLKWHWGISPEVAEKCQECGLCEEACTQHLPIIQRLKEIAEIGRENPNT
ncbi:aldo/keto reductase [Candidatus Sumerlaeota bacterium]|nr:aldo/keto reductase [Candidatus Sumerlaeota bacterium]